ncbi:DUF4153 domain-containing protein [Bacteroidota bacterium]
MRQKLIENSTNPEILEELYQKDKQEFLRTFESLYPELEKTELICFWKIRLENETSASRQVKISRKEVLILLFSCILGGLLIEIPRIFSVDQENFQFYEKNAGLIVFLGLSLYVYLTKGSYHTKQLVISAFVFLVSFLYINMLPSNKESDSITLAYIHLPLMIWSLFGLIYIDFNLKNLNKRIDYLKYNGDLAILSAIILICFGILTAVTLALFGAIDIDIEDFYFNNIFIVGLVSTPILATFIIKNYPRIAANIAPVIARIFSPLVLITLVVYLVTIAFKGKDPYNDRDFLLVFNLMLIGVMALIVFSIAEKSAEEKRIKGIYTLTGLTVISILIDLIALSAILYRMGEYGLSPNRVAVLGSNLLIFVHLLLIFLRLYKAAFRKGKRTIVEKSIASYLPIYTFWTVFIVFILPLISSLN